MVEYPPPYESSGWDSKRSDEHAIAKALNQIDSNFFFLREM